MLLNSKMYILFEVIHLGSCNQSFLIFDQHPELPLRHDYSTPKEMITGTEETKIKYEMNYFTKTHLLRLGSFKYRKFIVKPIFPRKNRYTRNNKA